MITVGADAPADGIDFTVLMPPGGAVSGRVDTPATPQFAGEGDSLGTSRSVNCSKLRSAADGSFSFGHLPKGSYLVSLFPTPPGMPSRAFQVGETDVRVDLVRPTLRTCPGASSHHRTYCRRVLIGFSTERSYVTATANADGSFSAQVQPARHTH